MPTSCLYACFTVALVQVANQRKEILRDRKCWKLIGCSAACVHFFFYCKNKENLLTGFNFSKRKYFLFMYYSWHFKHKIHSKFLRKKNTSLKVNYFLQFYFHAFTKRKRSLPHKNWRCHISGVTFDWFCHQNKFALLVSGWQIRYSCLNYTCLY